MNKQNGFILCDAMIAISMALLLLVPVVGFTYHAVYTYRKASLMMGATAIGRNEMERLRLEPIGMGGERREKSHQGRVYIVSSQIVSMEQDYLRYDVEVLDSEGTAYRFRRLEKKSP